MPSKKNELCNFWLQVIMDQSNKWWWLMCDSIIEHNDRPILCPEAKLTGESDLTPDEMEFIQKLYCHGVIPTTITDIMSKIVGKEFNVTTMSNIEKKLTRAIDEACGIDPKRTSAQKSLEGLRHMKIIEYFYFTAFCLLIIFILLSFLGVRMGISFVVSCIKKRVSGFMYIKEKIILLTNCGHILKLLPR